MAKCRPAFPAPAAIPAATAPPSTWSIASGPATTTVVHPILSSLGLAKQPPCRLHMPAMPFPFRNRVQRLGNDGIRSPSFITLVCKSSRRARGTVRAVPDVPVTGIEDGIVTGESAGNWTWNYLKTAITATRLSLTLIAAKCSLWEEVCHNLSDHWSVDKQICSPGGPAVANG